MIFLLTLAFICLTLYEIPDLIKKRFWKELAVVSFLLSLAFIISILKILKVDIPNPVKDVQYWVKNLMHLSYD